MSFTYSYSQKDADPTLRRIRLTVGDTRPNAGPRPGRGLDTNFSDEDIQIFRDLETTTAGAIASIFGALESEWARLAVSESEGDASTDMKEVSNRYKALKVEWREKATAEEAVIAGPTATPPGVIPLTRTDAYT